MKESTLVQKKDLFGFQNNKIYKFVKLVFNNYAAMMKVRYLFKKTITIQNVNTKPQKYKLYESNFEPFMRYCHIKDIFMAGWIKLPANKYKITKDTSYCQLEVEIDRKDIVSLKEKQDMAKFLQASWDIEVYSHDYTFPNPEKKQNEIFQIATTFQYYGDTKPLIKHLLTLKKCEKIDDEDVIVEECKTEKELIKKWVDLIQNMDPDIFYTYNGDSFDFIYLLGRGVIHGLVTPDKKDGYLMRNLSRLQDTKCESKKEFFSSSAYGDSEFYRMYIPGRLNYDLLIHYKRGMKKYSSYKLDFIANEILKQGKHDVSAKEIFKYYESNDPKLLKKIGEYCLEDTHLLQKLVDKQLILTNIVQLANVTYVPIGFLTTRGQTIKVYSQLLRKARQMDFVVPHTNFNEDNYGICIKFYDENIFDEDHLGDYIELDLGSFSNDINKGGSSTVKSKTSSKLNCKISQILDDKTIVVLTDAEITNEYFNRKIKYKSNYYNAQRVWPAEDLVDDSFTGATVLEAKNGMYTDNIAVLDFASLYPTIMISRNLCYSTFVFDENYLNIPDVKYETIAWNDQVEYKLRHTCEGVGKSGKSKGQVCGKQAYFEIENDNKTKSYFCRIHDPCKKTRLPDEKYQKKDVSYNYTIVQPHKNENGEIINKGVLPALLEELYSERKRVKREMAQAQKDGNKLLADILDSTQLAIKVSLNSCYGFLGRGQGNLILKELGSIVTSVGRMLIEQSRD
jgi:DNA polymerase elongation subunit (family B)